MSKLCNKSFFTEYCFINNQEIHVDLFIKNKNKYENEKINCSKKAQKEVILKTYEDSEYFLGKLESKLDESLQRYLCIDNDESDDE